MTGRTFSYSELDAAAAEVLLRARAIRSKGAVVIALEGDLGAGKTSLTQALARTLGVTEDVTSPTFVIQKSYKTDDADFKTLVHIDAYRLDTERELEVLGFKDMLKSPRTLIVVEWAERVAKLIPDDALKITLAHEGEKERTMTYA